MPLKRLLGYILVVLLLYAGAAYPASPVSTLATMKAAVRQMIQLEDTNFMPDSTLTLDCNLALLQVSTEIGGVEEQFRILTVAHQAHYAIADSIVTILYAQTLGRDEMMLSIRQVPPQFLEDMTQLTTLGADGENDFATPPALNYWADTLQMMPQPINNDDTVLIKCFVEHPYLSADSMALRLNSGYHDAALKLACAKTLASVRSFEASDWWGSKYDKAKAELRRVYARPMEILPSELKQ
jgi:hypothetical protein